MSDDKDFLSRWSRRKLAGEKEAPQPPRADAPPPAGTDAPPPAAAKPEEEFDPASLPPVESITGTTDITAFLRKGVPPELSRAALRHAWAADPAIRDFIGLSENAWDFTDPAAMPGFGPLDQSPAEIRQLLSEIFNDAERAAGEIVEAANKLAVAPDAGEAAESPPPAAAENDAQVASSVPPASGAKNIAMQQEKSPSEIPRRRRTHGGALPT